MWGRSTGRKKEKEYILNRCAYQHTDEERDLEVIVGKKKPLHVIILMPFCSLKSEYTECVTVEGKCQSVVSKIEIWWSLSRAIIETVTQSNPQIHVHLSDYLSQALFGKYGHQVIRHIL